MKSQPIIILCGVALSGCDVFLEQWEGTNALAILEEGFGREITTNTSDVVWEGSTDGNPSFVVKTEHVFVDREGQKDFACTLVAYVRNDNLGKLLWRTQTGVAPCSLVDPHDAMAVAAFAEANELGDGRFKPTGLIEGWVHRWFGL